MKDCILKTVRLADITPNPNNPRKTFDAAELAELAESVRSQGVLQPLLVRSKGKGKGFELIAGERRYRAALEAGLAEVPALVQKLDDKAALEAAISENEQRVDVPLFERAEAYHQLIEQHGASLADIAGRIGKSESSVRALLHLRNLPERSRAALIAGEISPALAQLIAARPTEALRIEAEEYVLQDGYEVPTVADLKAWVREFQTIELKGALFSQADKKLLPEAGSCKACPKRAGNMPELEGTRADICTDPQCYREKVAAHIDRERHKAAENGRAVLGQAECERLFLFGNNIDQATGWVEWDGPCYLVPGKEGDSFRSLFSDFLQANQIYLAWTPAGKSVPVVRWSDLESARRHAYPASKKASKKPPAAREQIKAAAAEKIAEEDRCREQIDEITGRGIAGCITAEIPAHSAEVLQRACLDLFDNCYGRARDEVYRDYGLAEHDLATRRQSLLDIIASFDAYSAIRFLLVTQVVLALNNPMRPDLQEAAQHWFTRGGV